MYSRYCVKHCKSFIDEINTDPSYKLFKVLVEVRYISTFYLKSNCCHERYTDTVGRENFMEKTLKAWVILEHSKIWRKAI